MPYEIVRRDAAGIEGERCFSKQHGSQRLPLLLLPVSLIILNPPPRPRLINPALGKDRLDPRDAFFGDVVRFSNFRIERFTIAIFRADQLLGVGALLEAQAVRTA